jgi:hypothetical protein
VVSQARLDGCLLEDSLSTGVRVFDEAAAAANASVFACQRVRGRPFTLGLHLFFTWFAPASLPVGGCAVALHTSFMTEIPSISVLIHT